MMKSVGAFLARNWKPLLTMLFAIVAAGYGAVQDVKGEIADNTDAIEALDQSHTAKIDSVEYRLESVKNDARVTRCILVAQVEGRQPLSCIDDQDGRDQRFEPEP